MAAAVMVQSRVRATLQLSRFAAVRTLVIYIQAHGRRMLAARLVVRVCASRMLQAHVRGHAARHFLRAARRASLFIQASVRQRKAKELLAQARFAATRLQASVRRRLAINHSVTARRACLRLQAAARRLRGRAELRRLQAERATLDKAATLLQGAQRRRTAMRHVAVLQSVAHLAAIARLHASAKLVQAVARRRIAIVRRHRAACRVTQLLRRLVARRRLARVFASILSLQSRQRGRRARTRSYRRFPGLREIASRVAEAHRAALADPKLWLCNRTNTALDVREASPNPFLFKSPPPVPTRHCPRVIAHASLPTRHCPRLPTR